MTSLPVLELTKRSQEIFNIIVNNYLETGTPVGSGVISSHPEIGLSSASVRAIMAELEDAGLLFSPHTSSGRLPTHAGLRLFVDGLMEEIGLPLKNLGSAGGMSFRNFPEPKDDKPEN